MSNQDLIYQLTRTVYRHLGPSANPGLVEALVTDLFRVIQPALTEDRRAPLPTTQEMPRLNTAADRLVISVFGLDHPGIVAAISSILAEYNCSIIDINQTVVGDKFAMVMIVNARELNADFTTLRDRFRQEGDRLGVRIYAQREDLFNAMHRV